MRHDFSGQDVVCCVAADADRADDLVGEYTQTFRDKGFTEEECYFYAVGSVFYV